MKGERGIMPGWLANAIICLIIIFSILSVVFRLKSGSKTDNAVKRGLNAAKTNISMGIVLSGIAFIQFTLFQSSVLRFIFGAVCLLLGLINAYAGIRNYKLFRSAQRRQS